MVSKHPCPRILQRYFFSSILTIIVENCGKSCFHHIAIYLRSLQMVPEVTISSTDIRKEGDQLTTNLLERFVTLLKGWGVMLGRRIRVVCFTTWRNASLSVLESVLQKLMAWIVELKIDQWSGPNNHFYVDAKVIDYRDEDLNDVNEDLVHHVNMPIGGHVQQQSWAFHVY